MDKYKSNRIQLFNSLKGEKEEFIPINAPHIGMYVCGPTVYSNAHLGNARTFVSFDVVYRYLLFLGYKVRYVRNITDVGHLVDDADEGEDKLAKTAKIEQLEPMEVAQKYTVEFRKVMQMLNALPPSIEPTATGHIIEQIEMVQSILDNGLAYEMNGSVYFDVLKYNEKLNYGELSGRNIEELYEGTRTLDAQDEKKNAVDFAIWKKAAPEHIMRWNSPWGEGFPGWHLECSAMGTKYLGKKFDIHGGGMDLKFPHHECEIAQGNAANGESPVNYWLHTNMLTLNGQRMSKSTGNTLLPLELFYGASDKIDKAYAPMVVRFFMLQAHYRSTLDFSGAALQAAEKGYKKLMAALRLLNGIAYQETEFSERDDLEIVKLLDSCYEFMNDDFNTPRTIAALFEIVAKVNGICKNNALVGLSKKTFGRLQEDFNGLVTQVLGLSDQQKDNQDQLDGTIGMLIDLRTEAKNEKNWSMSDAIRDQLKEIGIQLKDGKEGTSYSIE